METHVCGMLIQTKNGAKKVCRFSTKNSAKRVQFNLCTKNGANKACQRNNQTKIVRKRVQFNLPTKKGAS